jgi:hypothetical protein
MAQQQSEPSDSELATVRTALASFGVTAGDGPGACLPEAELRSIARGWDAQRAAIDQLYAIAETRYIDPALRFRADPTPESG